MALVPQSSDPVARMKVRLEEVYADEGNSLHDPALERVRQDNPAARSLPLLSAIAAGDRQTVRLTLLDTQQLILDVDSCRN
jgi:hypothetical protein